MGITVAVAVIVPVHNRAERVLPTLHSIQSQTCRDLQCIVVDDASRDSHVLSATLADNDRTSLKHHAYGSTPFPRFKLIRRDQQGGPANARNTGIQYALDHGAQWIAFCDSDDVWHPQKLEKQLALLQKTGAKVCHTEEIWIKEGRRHNPKKKHAKPSSGRIFRHCLPLCCVSPSTAMIHRSVLEDVGLFDGNLCACEDYELWLRIFSRYEAVLCPEYLVTKHGGHADQVSRRYVGMDRFRLYALLKAYRDCRPFLSPEELTTLIQTIAVKATILETGYRKHGGAHDLYTHIRHWAERGLTADLLPALLSSLQATFPWKSALGA